MAKIKAARTVAQKWKSLTHNGPAFPPPYKRLPKTVKLRYAGTPLNNLNAMAEEAAVLFAKVKLSEHKDVKNRRFINNFFEDFKDLLTAQQKTRVVQFNRLDFRSIIQHLKRSQGVEKSSRQVRAKRYKNEEDKKKYGFCKIDRKKQPVGNYMVEPPCIFRGREGHPGHGRIKLRVQPKDVIINCSQGFRVKPPKQGKWKSIVHDQTSTWLARYTNNLGQIKYIQLNQSSTLKAEGDREKYEVARALGKRIGTIRQKYQHGFNSKDDVKRQMAVALYIIDKFALRVGNEKGAGEADTVGCCTLRTEHITLKGNNKIKFDFRGKDSIRFKKEFGVPLKVYNILKALRKNKDKMLFDALNANDVNKFLKTLEPKFTLTAKVFRTYNASVMFQNALNKTKQSDKSSPAKLLGVFNKANLEVAQLCNHQKAVAKNSKKAIKKLEGRIASSEEKLRNILYGDFTTGRKRQRLDKNNWYDWTKAVEAAMRAAEAAMREAEKARKRAEKIAKESQEKAMKAAENARKMAEKIARDMQEKAMKEAENARKRAEKAQKEHERNIYLKNNLDLKVNGNEFALNTSKQNYIDPRITIAWCRKHDVELKKVFSKALLNKYKWAVDEVDGSRRKFIF